MSEEFLDEVHTGAMPAAVFLWSGFYTAMFYAGAMIATFYRLD